MALPTRAQIQAMDYLDWSLPSFYVDVESSGGGGGGGTPVSNNAYVNVNGTWKQSDDIYVNVSGSWKNVTDDIVYVNINGYAAYDKIDKLEDGKITWYTGPLKWEDIGLGFDQNYKAKDEQVVDEALKNNVLQFPTKWTPKVIDGGLDKPTK